MTHNRMGIFLSSIITTIADIIQKKDLEILFSFPILQLW